MRLSIAAAPLIAASTLLMARAEGSDLNAAIAEKWLKWEAVMASENHA